MGKVRDWWTANGRLVVFLIVGSGLIAIALMFVVSVNVTVAVTLIVIGGLALLLSILTPREGATGPVSPFMLIFFAALVLAGVAYVLKLDILPDTPESQIGVVIVLGASLLLVLLFIMSTGFTFLKLSNPREALGLPTGSVRALIALLLVLIFIMMGLFIFRSTAYVSTSHLTGISVSQLNKIPADKLVASYPSTITIPTYQVVYVTKGNSPTDTAAITITGMTLDQVADPPVGFRVVSQTIDGGTAPTYNVSIRNEITRDGADMGKQLLTTVGTLVVAVAGFYFGTRAVATARGENRPDERLAALSSLKTQGLITEDDFNKKKQQIVDAI
jgi:hypothetical protein